MHEGVGEAVEIDLQVGVAGRAGDGDGQAGAVVVLDAGVEALGGLPVVGHAVVVAVGQHACGGVGDLQGVKDGCRVKGERQQIALDHIAHEALVHRVAGESACLGAHVVEQVGGGGVGDRRVGQAAAQVRGQAGVGVGRVAGEVVAAIHQLIVRIGRVEVHGIAAHVELVLRQGQELGLEEGGAVVGVVVGMVVDEVDALVVEVVSTAGGDAGIVIGGQELVPEEVAGDLSVHAVVVAGRALATEFGMAAANAVEGIVVDAQAVEVADGGAVIGQQAAPVKVLFQGFGQQAVLDGDGRGAGNVDLLVEGMGHGAMVNDGAVHPTEGKPVPCEPDRAGIVEVLAGAEAQVADDEVAGGGGGVVVGTHAAHDDAPGRGLPRDGEVGGADRDLDRAIDDATAAEEDVTGAGCVEGRLQGAGTARVGVGDKEDLATTSARGRRAKTFGTGKGRGLCGRLERGGHQDKLH